jgi:hypothetical protein
VKLAAGVVAHKTREQQANLLAEEVGAVVCNVDDGRLGCADNHLQVLGLLSLLDADWCVVLEDDAIPVPNLLFHVKHALAHAPAPVVGLYLGSGNPSGQPQRRIRQAVVAAQVGSEPSGRTDNEGWAWITADCLIGSVGYAIRASLVDGMVGDLAYRAGEFPLRLSRWAQEWDIGVCYTVPSLVDHDDGVPIGYTAEEFQRLRQTRVPGVWRKAWCFGTREGWDTPAVPLGFCDVWSRGVVT